MVDAEELQRWLEQDEAGSRPYRAERLAKMLTAFSITNEGVLFSGGMAAAQAFTEIRLTYIHGLYLSTIFLALACIEQKLAGTLHAHGIERAASARLEKLLEDGLAHGVITDEEFRKFDHLRDVRNSYTHYRPLSHPTAWARRAMTSDAPIDEILEADTTAALFALGSFLARKAPF